MTSCRGLGLDLYYKTARRAKHVLLVPRGEFPIKALTAGATWRVPINAHRVLNISLRLEGGRADRPACFGRVATTQPIGRRRLTLLSHRRNDCVKSDCKLTHKDTTTSLRNYCLNEGGLPAGGCTRGGTLWPMFEGSNQLMASLRAKSIG